MQVFQTDCSSCFCPTLILPVLSMVSQGGNSCAIDNDSTSNKQLFTADFGSPRMYLKGLVDQSVSPYVSDLGVLFILLQ